MVHTEADAIEACLKMGLDALILNHKLYTKDELATNQDLT